jgi:hypothetical protein
MATTTKFTRIEKGSYAATVGDLHIEIERIDSPSGYLDWYLFISRTSDVGEAQLVFKTFSQTLAKAKALALDYVEAQAITHQAAVAAVEDAVVR